LHKYPLEVHRDLCQRVAGASSVGKNAKDRKIVATRNVKIHAEGHVNPPRNAVFTSY
jgi:hypothetical protein